MNAGEQLRAIHNFESAGNATAETFHQEETKKLEKSLQGMIGQKGFIIGTSDEDHAANPVITEDLVKKYAPGLAKQWVPAMVGVHNAAVLVFAHAVFEGLVQDLLALDFRCNPTDWEPRFADRTVSYKEVLGKDMAEVRNIAWLKERKDIERSNNLLENVQLLMGRCDTRKPDEYKKLRAEYKIETDDIKTIDRLRQTLVHKPSKPQPIPNITEQLQKLIELSALVSHVSGVCLFDLPISGIGLMVIGLSDDTLPNGQK